jgi:hypothetical protein
VAVTALEEGAKGSDAEIRRRCAELLPLARRSELDIRYDEFIAGTTNAPAPLPGWLRFRQLAGDDVSARTLFVMLGRADRQLLETLEKDSSRVGNQLAERSQRVVARGGRRANNQVVGEADVAALLLAAACSTDKNTPASHLLFNSLYQPAMRSAIRDSAAARRLVTPFLSRQLDEPWRLHQTVWLAKSLGLDEFMESTLKPEACKQAVAAAAKPDDSGELFQAATIATMLGLHDTIEGTLKPAARKLAERSAEKPDDPGKIYQTMNLLQTLQMQETIDSVLRPAAFQAITSIAAQPYDQYRFNMARNLGRSLQLKESVDQVLRPAAIKALISLSQQLPNNPGQMHVALNIVQTFDLKEANEDFLRPAARRLATAVAKSGDLSKLVQTSQFLSNLGVADVQETLRDAVRKLASESTNDANRLSQLVSVAHNLGMQDTIDRALKPQARRAMLAAQDRPMNPAVQQVLQLARTLQLKEGVPLALKAAAAKDLNSWTRAAAVMFVAEFGGKEHVSRMESLLNDTASIGSMGINFTTIHTELRDVALAAMVSLSGQSIDEYDYPYLKLFGAGAGPIASLSPHCFGFSDAAGRDAALRKWKERSRAKVR